MIAACIEMGLETEVAICVMVCLQRLRTCAHIHTYVSYCACSVIPPCKVYFEGVTGILFYFAIKAHSLASLAVFKTWVEGSVFRPITSSTISRLKMTVKFCEGMTIKRTECPDCRRIWDTTLLDGMVESVDWHNVVEKKGAIELLLVSCVYTCISKQL